MKTVQIRAAGGGLDLVDREIPSPAPGWVRIKVHACGVCHSDQMVKEGQWPGLNYPRVPGHEVAGILDEPGDNADPWKTGMRVGVGWYGGHCGVCAQCRRGNLMNCVVGPVTGFSHDGGYTEYMVAPAKSLAAIPDDLSFEDAAPLMCAGVTTYNSLRHAGAMPGDLVAVQGIGGLGHLGVQYAAKFGYRTVAISRGEASKDLALKLGAHRYIDTDKEDAAQVLMSMGGAKVILATAPSGKAMSALVNGIGVRGKMVVIGASNEPMEVPPAILLGPMRGIQGWAAGVAADSEDTMNFSMLSGVRPMIEKFPLERAAEAYERMLSGKARFRVVLTMTS